MVTTRQLRWSLLPAILVTLAGCGAPAETSTGSPAAKGAEVAPVGYFSGTVDTAGNMTIATTAAVAPGLHADVNSTTVPTGSGSNTVTLHTVGTPAWNGTALTLTGNVDVVNNFTTVTQGVTVVIDAVSLSGTTNNGPWDYADVTNSGTSGTIAWKFTLPSATNFNFIGHVNGVVPTSYMAYDSPLHGTNQGYSQGFGMDFTVNSAVTVTALGAYDANATTNTSQGFTNPVTVTLWNQSGPTIVAAVTFAAGASGTLMGGQRFQSITPVALTAGASYSIITFGTNYALWNSGGGAGGGGTTSTDSGAITFNGKGRNSATSATQFPTNLDTGPANRYSAGTFIYQ